MLKRFRTFWTDQRGGLISAEYLLLGTLLTIGLIIGVHAVRVALVEKIMAIAAIVCP